MKEQDRSLAARKQYHTSVFAQCFSPCGKFLAAANNHGYIAIFSLTTALSPDGTEALWKPVYSYKASEDGSIFCLASSDIFLISGGNGPICAWKWTDILNKSPKVIWSWGIPKKGPFYQTEVNTIVIDKQETQCRLYAGCGDNNVYVWDLETGEQLVSLSGHDNYIHSVSLKNKGQMCATASEDGTVKIWDMRHPSAAEHTLEPYKNQICARPEFGKWLGCVAMETGDDWLVCGGGPKMSLWHLRSLEATTVFDTPAVCQKTVMFYEDTIISAGSEPYVNHWYINGDQKSRIPCTPTNVFSVVVNTALNSHKVLCTAGNSPKIDVCTNFGYKAFSLTFS
ncbi:THO complex subunit 6 homolog [Ylistrum balloti]|uniref:THO complex subunit 6 homolog n=1 Tax=Ylistrum balloti TaxID=509963 RepID=UPI002905C698|nr:THO complex subunit 6 homolog [Ylistrum balloti]